MLPIRETMRLAETNGQGVRGALAGPGCFFILAVLAVSSGAAAGEPSAEPALVVRAIHPDRQADAVIGLFAGARAPHPAAAMAAWRRATGDHDLIGKPLQAVAAIFNPQMVLEWKSFHDGEFALGFEEEHADLVWSVIAPRDDGILAALVTSLRLSGGGHEPPIADPPIAVERLGGPGSAVAARLPGATVFASRRAKLASTVERLQARRADQAAPQATTPPDPIPLKPEDSGFRLVFNPDRLAPPGQADLRLLRIAVAARAAGVRTTDGLLGLKDDHLDLALVTRFETEGAPVVAETRTAALDPSWLTWFPASDSLAAFALVLGPGADFWNTCFKVADGVDRADPARAQLAPLRIRLNLLATARGVRLERDLWPLLRGMSLGVVADSGPSDKAWGVLIALHADDPSSAQRILDRVVSPLSTLIPGEKAKTDDPAKPQSAATSVTLGRVSGRPIEAAVRGSTVLLGWGEGSIARSVQSAESPEQSVAAIVKGAESGSEGRSVSRAGVVWPGRVALPLKVYSATSEFAVTLAEGPPLIWQGGGEGGRAWDLIRWSELRRLVARFLERIPQAPPEAP